MNKKINKDKMQRLLVIMLGGIGNAVLFLPAIKALKETLTNTDITLMIGEPGVERVYENEDVIDSVILFDARKRTRLLDVIRIIFEARTRHFDLALVASSTNAFKASLMTWLMGVPIRVGEDIRGKGFLYTNKIAFQDDTHETDGAIKLINALGIEHNDALPHLSINSKEQQAADRFLLSNGYQEGELLIGMHAGSGIKQVFKRWPKERFAELADKLIRQFNARIVLTGSEQEVGLNGEIFRIMENFPINAAGVLTIRQTAALIKQCSLFISNDSGIAHIASAVQTPLIVLFGNTEVKRIAPRGEHVTLIKKNRANDQNQETVKDITVKEVFECVKERLHSWGAGDHE